NLWFLPGGVMAARFLDRLKRSLFKTGPGADPDQEGGDLEGERRGFSEERWEAELEEEECVTERLRGTLCFDNGELGGEDDGEAIDSDSDFLGESLEDGLSSTGRRNLYAIHVIQSGGSDKMPAVITRRYSDFQQLHATLRRNYGNQMERVSFPRKKLRRNFTAETIAKRSRAFEQYLSHLCSLPDLRGAPSVRQFFYLSDLQAGQLAERFQDALGPLLNAKRLQHKLGWATSSHWFFTLVALACCFQEVEQLEEALEHCDHALRLLLPPESLALPLLQAVIRLSWQTGRDKQQWEEYLQQLEGAGPDDHVTIRDFLVKHKLQESDG
uniref:PX domain-containing protein n=1 Tax=Xiphophorus couchianus TaxID=32473 RepID=A0A3B5ME85_9TELE